VRVLCVSRVFVFSSSFDVDDERSSSLLAKEEETKTSFDACDENEKMKKILFLRVSFLLLLHFRICAYSYI